MTGLFVFLQNVVQQLRTHILRSCELVLLKTLKNKGRAVINELEVVLLHLALALPDQYVLGLYVRVHNPVLNQQIQGLRDRSYEVLQEGRVLPQLSIQVFVFDHVHLLLVILLVFDVVLCEVLFVNVIQHVAEAAIAGLVNYECLAVNDLVLEHF